MEARAFLYRNTSPQHSVLTLERCEHREHNASVAASLVVTPAHTRVGDLVLLREGHEVAPALCHPRLAPAVPWAPDVLVAKPVAHALTAALKEAGFEGRIGAVSGYRTREEQCSLYAEALEQGRPSGMVAHPGTSEHEAGLAVDLCRLWPLIKRPRRFAFAPHAHDHLFDALANHGFVERYPADKRAITGVPGEPWHVRYVGAPHAQAMRRQGLVLEQWLDFLQENASLTHPLYVGAGGSLCHNLREIDPSSQRWWAVARVAVSTPRVVGIPADIGARFMTLSGDNNHGVILTWPLAAH